MMKKFLATFLTVAMMAVMIPLMATSADAQTRRYQPQKKSVYQKHRNLINIGAGTGIGALIGAIAGGKKGAAVGALVGGGGAAVYSYGVKPKKNNNRRVYRRY